MAESERQERFNQHSEGKQVKGPSDPEFIFRVWIQVLGSIEEDLSQEPEVSQLNKQSWLSCGPVPSLFSLCWLV